MKRWGAAATGAVVAILGGAAASGHVIYPALLALWRRPAADRPEVSDWPSLTVVIPAFLEEAVVAAKVADVEANGYPGRLEIVVVADDPATADAARSTTASVIANQRRCGKAEALNRGVATATGEVVVITDANTALVPGSLSALARWFADPSVGAVAGEKRVLGSGGDTWYWRFESWLKRRESALGTTVGLVGELAAVRRRYFRPVPAEVPMDDLWLALDQLEAGRRIVYEPEAVALEEPAPDWRSEWERRTRNSAGIVALIWMRRHLLAPNRGLVALQLWGHRMMRSSLGPVAHVLLVLGALATVRVSRLARMFLLAHLLGAAATMRCLQGTAKTLPERLVGHALFLQAVALGGLVRLFRGKSSPLWEKRPRPSPSEIFTCCRVPSRAEA